MDFFDNIELLDCPNCGGVGCFEQEGDWCIYVQCLDCGAHTAEIPYKGEEEKQNAALRAAMNWNRRKFIQPNPGE